MIKPKSLRVGDKVAIVSLSSGILGEDYCQHQLNLGINRLKEFGLIPVFMPNTLKGIRYLSDNPKARADDLKKAFFDDTIKGIICAIGGDDTYKLLPYLITDNEFVSQVAKTPKLFTGFSDTTNNHLMFFKLGLVTFYGPNFLSDLAELDDLMLPYTKDSFGLFLKNKFPISIYSSDVWYEERSDFSTNEIGKNRIQHQETKGYEVLYGRGEITGQLLGGCLESIYDGYTGSRYFEQKHIYQSYQLMPSSLVWKDKIFFFETSEETPSPEDFRTYLEELVSQGVLKEIVAIMMGKPQNETYYHEYKAVLLEYAIRFQLPTIININFGHAYPRTVLPYGIPVKIDFDVPSITILEALFDEQ